MTRVAALVVALAVAALLGAADGTAVQAQNPKLFGTVGPEFTIVLRDAQGARVTQIAPGTYDVVVEDRSPEHNFHLTGPGVNRNTEVEFTGTANWTVTFEEGRYQYVCDPHAASMRGTLNVGNYPAASSSTASSSSRPSSRHGEVQARALVRPRLRHLPQDRRGQGREDDEDRYLHGECARSLPIAQRARRCTGLQPEDDAPLRGSSDLEDRPQAHRHASLPVRSARVFRDARISEDRPLRRSVPPGARPDRAWLRSRYRRARSRLSCAP